MSRTDTEKMLEGHGLTTAEILYRMPDHRSILQSYLWQDYDLAPEFPGLHKIIRFWRDTLEGPLHSVRYTHCHLIRPGEWRNVRGEFVVH